MALGPSSRPSTMPAAMASTFFSDPQISTPITSAGGGASCQVGWLGRRHGGARCPNWPAPGLVATCPCVCRRALPRRSLLARCPAQPPSLHPPTTQPSKQPRTRGGVDAHVGRGEEALHAARQRLVLQAGRRQAGPQRSAGRACGRLLSAGAPLRQQEMAAGSCKPNWQSHFNHAPLRPPRCRWAAPSSLPWQRRGLRAASRGGAASARAGQRPPGAALRGMPCAGHCSSPQTHSRAQPRSARVAGQRHTTAQHSIPPPFSTPSAHPTGTPWAASCPARRGSPRSSAARWPPRCPWRQR